MKVTLLLTVAFTAAAQQPKSADNCVPPPSALAPTLPARILDGMGTVHLPITTSSAEAQRFFDQGVAQMHSFWAREAERRIERQVAPSGSGISEIAMRKSMQISPELMLRAMRVDEAQPVLD